MFPAVLAVKVDADQAEVFFFWQIKAALTPGGAAVVGFQNHSIAAHQEAVIGVGKRHIQGVRLGVEVNGLPGAGGCRWQAGGHASAQAEAQAGHQQQLDDGFKQALHGFQNRWARFFGRCSRSFRERYMEGAY